MSEESTRRRRERRTKEETGDVTTPSKTESSPSVGSNDSGISNVQKLSSIGEDEVVTNWVWVADDQPVDSPLNQGFIGGEIKKQVGENYEVALNNGSMVTVKKNAVFPMNHPKGKEINNLTFR